MKKAWQMSKNTKSDYKDNAFYAIYWYNISCNDCGVCFYSNCTFGFEGER